MGRANDRAGEHFRALAGPCGQKPPKQNALTCGKTGQGIVEVAGIEPASSSFSVGLLRAQPVLDCRELRRYRRQCAFRIRLKFP